MILQFWGKARPREGHASEYHPLPYHSLDVAAVGVVWLEQDPRLLGWLSGLLGLSREATRALIGFLLALHDIGKFAAAFQIKVPERFPKTVFDSMACAGLPSGFRHDDFGVRLLWHFFDKLFPEWSESDRRALEYLLIATAGHHGVPPTIKGYRSELEDLFQPAGIASAHAFIREIEEFLPWPEELPARTCARRASTAVAGFVVACDWLGSNQAYFPYTPPEVALCEYWQRAQKAAMKALESAGLFPAIPDGPVGLGDLLAGSHVEPTPLQEWAATTPLLEGPGVYVLEDETGSGKTEAALILASRLMTAGYGQGLYVAMPTMATANALFERVATNVQCLFRFDPRPTLSLVHGRSHLREMFRSLRLGESVRTERYGEEASASENCAQWIADDRRKAFLADVGVGTVDQALLAILPARFQALRLFGLARKVLILDEVHAYDAYVEKGIERLIEWQLNLGGSCILLSATLPHVARRKLARTVGQDFGISPSFPRAMRLSPSECTMEPVRPATNRGRALPVRFLADAESALDAVADAAASGKAVVYIRNSVDDAMEAHEALSQRGLRVELFHARMALIDRFRTESRTLEHFGKTSRPEERAGRILVATQVVEQSLDIDFDAMITDLAPIDLLIQRAGRLWRHERPERRGAPELLVVSPEPVADASVDWYARCFPRGQWVYRDHARLWLTAKALSDAGEITTPDGVDALIEAVYGEDCEDRVPQALVESLIKDEGRASAQSAEAARRTLDPNRGYAYDGPWEDDARVATRLEDQPRVTLRLGLVQAGRIMPYAAARKEALTVAQGWALSEVQVARSRVAEAVLPPGLGEAVEAARAEWGRFDGDKLLVVLEPAEGEGGFRGPWSARARDEGGNDVWIIYESSRGLTLRGGKPTQRTSGSRRPRLEG